MPPQDSPSPQETFPGIESPSALRAWTRKQFEREPFDENAVVSTFPHLDEEALLEMAKLEMARLRSLPEPEPDRPSRDSEVILHLSVQAPQVLTNVLHEIFALDVNATCYYADLPWRHSGKASFELMRQEAWNGAHSARKRLWAWQAMIATKDPDILLYVVEHWEFMLEVLQEAYPWARRRPPELNTYLRHGSQTEWDPARYAFRPLIPAACYHLRFSDHYEESLEGYRRVASHPTWGQAKPDQPAGTHGGDGEEPCALCQHRLFMILTLESIPENLGVTGMNRLRFATCLSCFPWENDFLFYRHHAATGEPESLPIGEIVDQASVEPPGDAFKQGPIWLTETPPRWHHQYWGNGNNLNKFGGAPDWVQDSSYPPCPQCGLTMPYLAQLDDGFPGHEMWSGDSGHLYLFWCDRCRISGWNIQCL